MPKKKVKKFKEKKTSDLTKQSELLQIINEIRRIIINIKTEKYKIGELLVRGKKIVGHGKFKDWVKDNFEFSYATAKNFMNVYKHCSGRPELVRTIKPSILYMITGPDFPEDLREHILENGKNLKKIKYKKLRDINRRFKEGKLDLESSEIKNLFKKTERKVGDEGYAKQVSNQIRKIKKLSKIVLSIKAKIKWPINPSTNQVELEDDDLKKVNQLIKKIVNAVQDLKPGHIDQSDKPNLSLVA
ncbi:MAG: DUF3102 domain-containing protein [Syntrophales bacterium]